MLLKRNQSKIWTLQQKSVQLEMKGPTKTGNPDQFILSGDPKSKGATTLQIVLDSGAVRTIVPPNAIPGMTMRKMASGGSFIVSNEWMIPNQGEVEMEGRGTLNQNPMRIQSQMADVTKPVTAANEMIDANNMIILHETDVNV